MSSRRLSAVLPVCLIAAASLTLAACGGGGSGSNTTAERQEDERKQVQFTKCLREHGLNVTSSASGEIKVTGSAKSGALQTFEAAQNACRKYRPRPQNLNLTPAERAQRQDQVLKFAQCMRSHGVNVPNPTTEGGGVGIRIKGGLGKINPESPAFQAAQKACQGLLPKFGRRGPGGGPATQSSDGGAGGPKSGATLSIGPVTKAGG